MFGQLLKYSLFSSLESSITPAGVIRAQKVDRAPATQALVPSRLAKLTACAVRVALVLPILAVIAALLFTGLMPVLFVALVILLPALAPFLLVLVGILSTSPDQARKNAGIVDARAQ